MIKARFAYGKSQPSHMLKKLRVKWLYNIFKPDGTTGIKSTSGKIGEFVIENKDSILLYLVSDDESLNKIHLDNKNGNDTSGFKYHMTKYSSEVILDK